MIYPVGFAQPRHRAVRSERNGVPLMLVSSGVKAFRMHQGLFHREAWITDFSSPVLQNSCTELYQKSFQNRSKILPKWCQNRGLEVSWGRVGGSWSPAGPKTHPDAFQDAKTTFVAHPWGMLFGTILVFFCVFFCCLFVLAPRTVFYGFLCDFELIFDSIS